MDIMNQITTLINNVGVPVAMVIYFAWRDVKFMQKLDSTLDVIVASLKKDKEED